MKPYLKYHGFFKIMLSINIEKEKYDVLVSVVGSGSVQTKEYLDNREGQIGSTSAIKYLFTWT